MQKCNSRFTLNLLQCCWFHLVSHRISLDPGGLARPPGAQELQDPFLSYLNCLLTRCVCGWGPKSRHPVSILSSLRARCRVAITQLLAGYSILCVLICQQYFSFKGCREEPRAWAGDTEGERMSVPAIQKMLFEALGEAEGEYLFGCSGLQSIVLQRVGHNWSDLALTHASLSCGMKALSVAGGV